MNFIKQHKLHLTLLTVLLIIFIGSLVFLINSNEQDPTAHQNLTQTQMEDNDTANKVDIKKNDNAKNNTNIAIDNDIDNASEDGEITSSSFFTITDERDSSIPQNDNENILETENYKLKVNDEEYNLNIPNNKEINVYELMQLLSASSQKPFIFTTKKYSGMGHFVQSINGIKNNAQENKFWIYYINEESAKMGISQYTIKEGDVIMWKFKKSEF